MKYEIVKVEELIPYQNNTRTHSKEQIIKLRSSLKEFGFVNPVLIDKDNGVIAGHGRIEAAKLEKIKEVPCVRIEHLTEAQKKAYIIADNRLAMDAGWDEELLKIELNQLNDLDFNLSLTGFEDIEIKNILKDEEEVEEDDFEMEMPQEPYSKLGDIWLLGQHRLMCGDSTSEEDIKKLVNNNPIYIIQTDPPYGMNAVSKSGVLSKTYKTDIIGDDNNTIAVNAFNICQKLYKNSAQVWWGANYYTECLPSSECWIVWDKNNGKSDQTDCELAWANFRSVVRQFTLSSEKKNRVHPTQKPVKLFEWIINKFDKESTFKTVLDLFGGSGFTLLGAEQMNRTSFTMEFDPKFVDVIVNRYYKYIKDNNINKELKLIRDEKEIDIKETNILVGE